MRLSRNTPGRVDCRATGRLLLFACLAGYGHLAAAIDRRRLQASSGVEHGQPNAAVPLPQPGKRRKEDLCTREEDLCTIRSSLCFPHSLNRRASACGPGRISAPRPPLPAWRVRGGCGSRRSPGPGVTALSTGFPEPRPLIYPSWQPTFHTFSSNRPFLRSIVPSPAASAIPDSPTLIL